MDDDKQVIQLQNKLARLDRKKDKKMYKRLYKKYKEVFLNTYGVFPNG